MKCPGQDSQYWKPDAIYEVECPECGSPVEFFKDETTRKCSACGHRFVNPELDFGCAAYCKYAEQCIGNLPPELIAQKQDLLKDRVAIEVKRLFGRDFKKIGHTMRAARYAEEIGKAEQGDLAVILAAACLHDVGVQGARDILGKLGAGEELAEEVYDIIRGGAVQKEAPLNARCVRDGNLVATLEDRQKAGETVSAETLEDAGLWTESARRVAQRVLGH